MIRKNVNQNDKRVIKTKKAILNAFTELLSTNDINDISITDIARKAEVNRKTIYNYYNGVYEILDEIENECIKNYEQIVSSIPASAKPSDLYDLFDAITSILRKDNDFYSRLINIKNNSKIVDKIYKSVIDRLKVDLLSTVDPDKSELVAHYITTGMVSAYMYWYNSGQVVPLEEFSKDLSKLVLLGITPYFKK